jgi:abequosyltransferase
MRYRVSFCIPTFNFAPFIRATLDSILAQADERVQIVVVDGGSTDGTQEILSSYAAKHPHLQWIQRQQRFGIDLDILETVVQANADYCWLFSSDDVLAPGSVACVMEAIELGDWDVMLTGVILCDRDMQPLTPHRFIDCGESRTFDWGDPTQRGEYFRRAITTTAFFSFISNVVVRRERWISAPTPDCFVGSCWIIAAKVLAMSQGGLRVRLEPRTCVLKRGENDSFMSNGMLWRIALGIRGFRQLPSFFFGPNTQEGHHICRVIRNEFPLWPMLMYRLQIFETGDRAEAIEFGDLMRHHFDGQFVGDWFRRAVLSLIPVQMLLLTRRVYRFCVWPLRQFRAYQASHRRPGK